ncbi:class I SAM-dependent methyltransferase family protein, partial [Propionibacterium freudenreichii]|uniref:class I SAM-dependent methyltransferase family protein n=3 Tax=Bacteria TaxID=2 RepID=UPI003851D803
SDGVATGVKHGFDSGSSLEKVYQNQPQGKNFLGKVVDQFYLNNIGWRGIRIRKQHLLELGQLAIEQLQKTASDTPI